MAEIETVSTTDKPQVTRTPGPVATVFFLIAWIILMCVKLFWLLLKIALVCAALFAVVVLGRWIIDLVVSATMFAPSISRRDIVLYCALAAGTVICFVILARKGVPSWLNWLISLIVPTIVILFVWVYYGVGLFF